MHDGSALNPKPLDPLELAVQQARPRRALAGFDLVATVDMPKGHTTDGPVCPGRRSPCSLGAPDHSMFGQVHDGVVSAISGMRTASAGMRRR